MGYYTGQGSDFVSAIRCKVIPYLQGENVVHVNAELTGRSVDCIGRLQELWPFGATDREEGMDLV